MVRGNALPSPVLPRAGVKHGPYPKTCGNPVVSPAYRAGAAPLCNATPPYILLYNTAMSTRPASLEPVTFEPQTAYCGDCEEILAHFPDSSVDLVYIDPPFNSNRNYEVFWGDTQEKRAFDDRYGDAMAYIDYMRPRVGSPI